MIFLDSLKKANLSSLKIMGQPIILDDTKTITGSIDDVSQSVFARAGGKTSDVESALFVSEEEFQANGGHMGSRITFPETGKSAKVVKIANFQGVLYLTIQPFKP